MAKTLGEKIKIVMENPLDSFVWFFKYRVMNLPGFRKFKKSEPVYVRKDKYSYAVSKNTPQVLICGTVPFYDIGGGQRSSQLAKTFHQMGYEVHYVYAFDSSESKKFEIFNPCITHVSIDKADKEYLSHTLNRKSLIIFEAPYKGFMGILEYAINAGIKTVYEHIDNWETSLGSLVYDKESFITFIQKSDFLVATSKELVKQLNGYTDKEVLYCPNAVDTNLFEPAYDYDAPKDLVIGEDKTLLYFGSLWGEWFDWDLLKKTAELCKDSTFNLIGDDSMLASKKKELPDNVHFLGLKKQTELPAYLTFADIAFLPFKSCEIGAYVSPLKIFEYISMGKKVLSTPLPDVKGYPNTYCSNDSLEWANEIKKEIILNDFRSFTDKNSWYNRCNALIDLTGFELLDRKKFENNVSVVVLNYNNAKVIFRCIDSLLEHNVKYNYEIIVVDNQSTDGSYEKLKSEYSGKITLLRNDRNGCSSGRNLGSNSSSRSYLVYLDSDQWVVSDRWLDMGLYVLDNNPSAGAVSWSAGWFTFSTLEGPIADNYDNRSIYPSTMYRVDVSYLATSGLVMKKRVFDLCGGFDIKYDPTCFEDTDLSFKILQLGLVNVFCPYMSMMHIPHQTTLSGTTFHKKMFMKNSSYFKSKWEKTGLLDKQMYNISAIPKR